MLIDGNMLIAAICALFTALSTGGGAVIKHLLHQNEALLIENKALREDGIALAKSAIAALDKLGSK